MPKIAVFAPIPNVSMTNAETVNPGVLRNPRAACTSCLANSFMGNRDAPRRPLPFESIYRSLGANPIGKVSDIGMGMFVSHRTQIATSNALDMIRSLKVMLRSVLAITCPLVFGFIAIPWLNAAESSNPDLERKFAQTVKPFLASYCTGCHSGTTPAAQFDLRPYDTADAVIRDYGHWNLVLDKLAAKEMPPKAVQTASCRGAASRDPVDRGDAFRARRGKTRAIPGECWPGG